MENESNEIHSDASEHEVENKQDACAPTPTTTATTNAAKPQLNQLRFFIDPSINSLGYAVFLNSTLHTFGTLKATRKQKLTPLSVRVQQMSMSVMSMCLQKIRLVKEMKSFEDTDTTIIIEEPEMFDSATSLAAVHNSSLKKLLLVVGALSLVGPLLQAKTVYLPVTTWKGQLKKAITRQRAETKHKLKFSSSDEADAVAMGDWYIGHIVKTKTKPETKSETGE